MGTTRKDGAHVRRDSDTVSTNRQEGRPVVGTRDRFGGLDLPAALAGTMAALGMLALLGAIASAWTSQYGQDLSRDQVVSPTGVGIGLAIVVLSALFGGWVTGRACRYGGTGNGLLAGILLVGLTAGIGWLLGSQVQDSSGFRMPGWVTQDATSNAAVTTAVVAGVVALICAAIGGALGSFWHRRVDRSLVTETEDSAFAPYPEEQRLVTPPRVDESGYDSADDGQEPTTTRRTPARTSRKRTAD